MSDMPDTSFCITNSADNYGVKSVLCAFMTYLAAFAASLTVFFVSSSAFNASS